MPKRLAPVALAGVLCLPLMWSIRATATTECTGDCHDDGAVAVDELITMLRIASSEAPLSDCLAGDTNGDSQVTVDEIVAAVNNALHRCPATTDLRNLSRFVEFYFERQPALGFCPPLDAVFSASIAFESEDRYRLELSVLQAGQAGVDACLPRYFGEAQCAVTRAQPARLLTPAEVQRLRQVFGAVRVFNHPEPICERVVIDPCVISTARWDGFAVNDYACSASGRVDSEQMSAITEFLDELGSASASQRACLRSGCSGEVCAEEPIITTCEFRPEYACFWTALCERQPNGLCGWTPTESLLQCLAEAR